MFKFKWGRCSHALGIIYRKVIMSLLFCVRKRKKKREKFEGNLPYLPSTWGKHVKRKKIFFCTWGIHKEKDHFYFFLISFVTMIFVLSAYSLSSYNAWRLPFLPHRKSRILFIFNKWKISITQICIIYIIYFQILVQDKF